MNLPLFLLIFVVITVALLGSLGIAYRLHRKGRKRSIERRLGTVIEATAPAARTVSILSEERRTAWHLRLQSWAMSQVDAAGLKWSRSKVLAICLACAFLGVIAGLRIGQMLPRAAAAFVFVPAIAAACLPFLYLSHLRGKRLNKIESQLPDALDFMARSLRVGNSFLITLEMLVEETEEPLRGEFASVTGEIRLGSPLAEPLHKMLGRVPLVDLRMFVSAVLLQRETGGNLGLLLTRISASIRDRFRVRGQVAAAASQAQLSATIISAMPFVVLGGILVMSPGYFKMMTDDAMGRKLLVAACIGQVAGFLIMRRIVRIKV